MTTDTVLRDKLMEIIDGWLAKGGEGSIITGSVPSLADEIIALIRADGLAWQATAETIEHLKTFYREQEALLAHYDETMPATHQGTTLEEDRMESQIAGFRKALQLLGLMDAVVKESP